MSAPQRPSTMKPVVRRRVAIGAVLVVCSACDAAASPDGFLAIDSAGVTIADNGTLATEIDSLAEPAVRIGSADAAAAAEYSFDYVTDVDALPDGRIVVVDNRGARVAVFDADGRWVRDLGRAGAGPGEYRTPLSLHRRGDTLLVWDMAQRRFTAWLGDSLVGMPTLAVPRRPARLALAGDLMIYERETGQYSDPAPASGWLESIALDATDTTARRLVGPYAVPDIGWQITDPATGNGMMVNPPVFSPAPRWAYAGGRLVWTSGDDGRIEVRDDTGRLRRIIESARTSRPVGDAEIDAYFSGMKRRFGMSDEDLTRTRTTARFAPWLPVYASLVLDDRGNVWAALHDPTTMEGVGTSWDVFDEAGRHVRTVVFGERFALRRVRGGRAYGITTTDDGVHLVDVYIAEE